MAREPRMPKEEKQYDERVVSIDRVEVKNIKKRKVAD